MKVELSDVTFLILVRLDSIQRLENIITVAEQLTHHFDTNITILEVDTHPNNILQKHLKRGIQYSFCKDKDPVLYKTKYFNQMTSETTTKYLALWDADVVVDKKAIINAIDNLRNSFDIVYPYNGICYDVPTIIRERFMSKKDIRLLYRHMNKMEYLYDHNLVGGAVFVDKEKYIYCGCENEKHYGWGNDDFDRYYRFVNLGMKIYRTNNPLFHLSHPRINNSSYRSIFHMHKTSLELSKTENSCGEEILFDNAHRKRKDRAF